MLNNYAKFAESLVSNLKLSQLPVGICLSDTIPANVPAYSGRAALSLGCCGARAYLDVLTDSVALFAIPGAKLADYCVRIAALTDANAVIARFHTIRRHNIAAGQTPTVKESLAAIS